MTVEVVISNPTSVPTLQDVPRAPGTARWQGLSPLTEWLCRKAAEAAFEGARAKAG
ncbi:MAG: hypothetical protein ABIL01_22200 [Pseudomonadota bacterium]